MSHFTSDGIARIVAAVVVLGTAALITLGITTESNARRSQGLAAFEKMMPVFQHPRCLNCHRSDFPRIREQQQRHYPRVRPVNEGMGAGGEQCLLCHKEENNVLTRIPGAHKWRMAPYSMSWDGLDAADICENLKDRAMNGDRDLAAIKHHLEHDKLVHWAWSPGKPRAVPPVSYQDLLKLTEQWVKAGGPCPRSPDE